MSNEPTVNPIVASAKAVKRFATNSVRLFVQRGEGSTSRLGVILQLIGVAAALYGLFLWSPALAYVSGGVLAVVIGERL